MYNERRGKIHFWDSLITLQRRLLPDALPRPGRHAAPLCRLPGAVHRFQHARLRRRLRLRPGAGLFRAVRRAADDARRGEGGAAQAVGRRRRPGVDGAVARRRSTPSKRRRGSMPAARGRRGKRRDGRRRAARRRTAALVDEAPLRAGAAGVRRRHRLRVRRASRARHRLPAARPSPDRRLLRADGDGPHRRFPRAGAACARPRTARARRRPPRHRPAHRPVDAPRAPVGALHAGVARARVLAAWWCCRPAACRCRSACTCRRTAGPRWRGTCGAHWARRQRRCRRRPWFPLASDPAPQASALVDAIGR